MILKARLIISGVTAKHFVPGREVDLRDLTFGDLTEKITEVEAYLKRILGLKVKIETEVR